jgi:hypothetical protein
MSKLQLDFKEEGNYVAAWCKKTKLENLTLMMVPWYTKLHARGGMPFVPVPSLTPTEKSAGSSYYKFTLH